MKISKKIVLWILAIFFALSAIFYIPSVFSLFAILITVLVIPISKWQDFLKKYIKGKIKIVIVVVLVILSIFTVPTTELDSSLDNSTVGETTTSTSSDPTTNSTNAPTAELTTTPTTEPTTTPTTEPSHTHKYKAATCTTPKTCSCGATEGKANGHSWKDATCKAPKTCKSCGVTEGTAKEHTWKDATYSSPKKCSDCGKTDGNPLEKPGKENYHGHVYTGGSSSTKFHYEEKCPGKNSHEITWNDVDKLGLKPCGTCVLK